MTAEPGPVQQTCAVGVALTGGIDWLLTDHAPGGKAAVLAASTVPVTEHRGGGVENLSRACTAYLTSTLTCTEHPLSVGSRRCSSGPS